MPEQLREPLSNGPPAAERVVCPHAERCSGCPLIDLSYPAQLARKRERLGAALAGYDELGALGVPPVTGAEERTGYRVRAKLMVAPGPRIGLFAKGGEHEILDLPGCQVLAPGLLEVTARLRELLAAPPAAAGQALVAHERGCEGRGALVAIDLREVSGPGGALALVTLVLDSGHLPSSDQLSAAAAAVRSSSARIAGVAANFRAADSPQVLGGKTTVLAGIAAARDYEGPVYHLASYGSFVQVSRGQARKIHELLGAELAPAGATQRQRILDLYGGSGAISLGLLKRRARVTLVESFGPAAENARSAAEEQGLSELVVRTGDVARTLQDLVRAGARFDSVIANPPRRGIAPAARLLIARLAPRSIAYISCNPDTLARDLDHFARLGYAPSSVHPFDMIPLTDEIETVAWLRRRAPSPARVAYENDELLIVEKAAHEPIRPDPACSVSLEDRVHLLPGAARAVPVSTLELAASGLVAWAKDPETAARLERTLAAGARKVYVAAVRGIAARKGTVNHSAPVGHGAARTRYRTLSRIGGHSLLRVVPYGMRAGQVQRDCAKIGHHVLGDLRTGHPPTNRHFEEKHGLDRAFLHCVALEVADPDRGDIVARAPLPGELRGVLARLGMQWTDTMAFPDGEREMAAQATKN